MALTILGITFFGFLILGVPVAFAIALSAVCTILYEGLPRGGAVPADDVGNEHLLVPRHPVLRPER